MPESRPRVPAARSLLIFQEHLARGMWADRHIQAMVSDPESAGPFLQVVQCTQDYTQQRQDAGAAGDSGKMRQAATRNRVCLCHAVCPEETIAWVQCMRALRKQRKSNSTLGNCDEHYRRVEMCTQWASTRLLHAAVLPKDRHEVF